MDASTLKGGMKVKAYKESLESSLLLYAITPSAMTGKHSLKEKVEGAILGGATMIQLREKISKEEYIALAKEIKDITDKYNIPLIINDEVEVALACDAAGVHIGQKDMAAISPS